MYSDGTQQRQPVVGGIIKAADAQASKCRSQYPTRDERSDRHARGLMALVEVRAGYVESPAARERITTLLRYAAWATIEGAFFSSSNLWGSILQDIACHHRDPERARHVLDSVRASFRSAENPIAPHMPAEHAALKVSSGKVSAQLLKNAGLLTSPRNNDPWLRILEPDAKTQVKSLQQAASAPIVDALVDQIAACETAEQLRRLLHAYEDLLPQGSPRLPLADSIRNAINLEAALARPGTTTEPSAT